MINYDKQNRQLSKLRDERDIAIKRYRDADAERRRLYSILDGIMHETRRLNTEVASACEEVAKCIEKNEYDKAALAADDAFYSSGLISSRLTFTDFDINPESLSRQTRYSIGVYKKFDKARRILSRSAKRRSVRINIKGPSRNEINVLQAFEMVPFVLLDNAVKYSPENQDITVEVTDDPRPGIRVSVIISSTGPVVPRSEIDEIIKRGVRGTQAVKSGVSGEGIGLYLAETLTRLANGQMQVSSSPSARYKYNQVEYSDFVVNLDFC